MSNSHISATGHAVHFAFGSVAGFSGRRIECLYFQLDQIQDHGRQPSCVIFSGHISETVHPVQYVFGSAFGSKSIGENNTRGVIRLVTI